MQGFLRRLEHATLEQDQPLELLFLSRCSTLSKTYSSMYSRCGLQIMLCMLPRMKKQKRQCSNKTFAAQKRFSIAHNAKRRRNFKSTDLQTQSPNRIVCEGDFFPLSSLLLNGCWSPFGHCSLVRLVLPVTYANHKWQSESGRTNGYAKQSTLKKHCSTDENVVLY